jgi:NAD(P)-dependent dehydrogenase (short-subunit alcohol dehydrogenase family)
MGCFSKLSAACVITVLALLSAVANAETVLITGANQGIGLEFARQYAARGWTVVATHRRDTPPEDLVKLQKQYPKVRIERMDVTDHAQIDSLAARMKADGKVEPIDIVINNAALKRTAPITDRQGNANQLLGTLDYELFDDFMHTNVAGPLHMAEAFREHVKTSKLKKFITISSAAGTVSVLPRTADNYWYRISKSALNQAMRLVSVDYQKDGVLVVFFHPGGVRTESFKNLNLQGLEETDAAVAKLVKTIDGLTMKDMGRFLKPDGTDQAW